MALFKFSLRELTSRPVRVALTALSIVIGVAAVVSVTIATKTTRAANEAMFAAVTGRAALDVTAEGGGSFPISVAAELDQLPGVQAVPLIRRFTIVYFHEKKVRVQALGIVPDRDRLVRDFELTSGQMVGRGSGVVLDATFASGLGIGVGDQLKMLTPSGLKESEVVGLLEARGGSAVAAGGLVYMSLALAESRFKMRGTIDSVQLVLDEDADLETTQAAVAAKLPLGLSVRQPNMRSQLAEETMMATEQGLQLATAFALVIAAFIIFNTFQMTVGERRRQLGILRAIGATRRQITTLILREGLLMGLLGTVAGGLVGAFGAHVLTLGSEQLLQTEMPPIQVTMLPFVLAILFGVGLSLVATLVPARRAGRLSPSEAMSVVAPGEIEAPHLKMTIAGLVIVLAAAIALGGCAVGWFPIDISVIAVVILLVGMVFLLPAAIPRLSQVVERMWRPIFGIEGRLARRQLVRHPSRTAMTVGMLFIAIATGVGLANTIIDNIDDVQQWYRQAIVGDFFVRALMPDMATGEAADMPDGLGDAILKIPGVEDLDAVRLVKATSGENSVIVVTREFKTQRQAYFDLVAGDGDEVLHRLHEGEVVVSSVLAQRTNLKLGDSIPLETREGPRQLRIAGIANDYLAGGMTIYMHRDVAEKLLEVKGVDAYVVQADNKQLPAVKAALQTLCNEHGLLLQSYADLVRFIERMMNSVVGSLWALLALGFVIAAFGLVNTLAMNILEQTREIGVLRVVAMTRRQVRRTILAQAAMMGLMGLAPGALMGLLVAYLINLSTLPTTGHAVLFVFRPWLLVVCFAAAYVIVLAAAYLPAERAARLKLSDALQYE
ncbi:MAG: FtsX-like permease family protein [Planctomycetota bacterium]|nr:FtsX-like permease family protein [Planctomycetota bacterium]